MQKCRSELFTQLEVCGYDDAAQQPSSLTEYGNLKLGTAQNFLDLVLGSSGKVNPHFRELPNTQQCLLSEDINISQLWTLRRNMLLLLSDRFEVALKIEREVVWKHFGKVTRWLSSFTNALECYPRFVNLLHTPLLLLL